MWSFENLTLTVAVCLQQVAQVVAGDGKLGTDLGQLPGHHPLIKDGMSDEGVSEQKHCLLSVCRSKESRSTR